MTQTINQFFENHFGLVMVLCLALGLLSPLPGMLPDYVPPIILAVMMGFSCSKIRLADLKAIRIKDVAGFYTLRFMIVPLLGFLFFQTFLPAYTYAVLLILLLPMAVSGAALAAMFGGNATLALTGTVLTSLIAPFMIPLVFEFAGYEIALDTFGMFLTLAGIVFVPALVYFCGIRFFEKPKQWIQTNSSFASVLLFSIFIMIVVSRLRDEILADPVSLIVPGIILLLLYVGIYALGWLVFLRSERSTRIAYTVFSGMNNIGLGVSLAIMYFPVQEKIYLIICEFLWVFLLSGFQYFLKKAKY
jgi:predicted Na+-dependent transporter